MIHRFFISVPSWKSAPGAATVVPELVQGAITSLNAEIVSTHETATHIIAQHIRQPDIQQALKSNPSTKLCGLLWLFASIEANQILDPSASPLYQPFPSQAAEQHSDEESASSYSPKVSCTGYVGVSRLMVSALCQSIGLQFEGQLYLTGASATDVLIAIDVDGDSPKISGARYSNALQAIYRHFLFGLFNKFCNTDSVVNTKYNHPHTLHFAENTISLWST